MRLLLIVVSALLVAGCKPAGNSPDRYERKSAFEKCVGTWAANKTISEVSDEQRLGCTQAVYGGE